MAGCLRYSMTSRALGLKLVLAIVVLGFELMGCKSTVPSPIPTLIVYPTTVAIAMRDPTEVATATPTSIATAVPNPTQVATATPNSVPGATSVAIPAESDEVAIYQAVIRKLAGLDDNAGGIQPRRTLYILRTTSIPVGDPELHERNPIAISDSIQTGIVAALASAPVKIVWVDRFDQAPTDKNNGQVLDHGVVISLGNLYFQSNSKVLVPASTTAGPMTTSGRTYVVQEQAGVWTVTGTTGFEWMS